MSTKRPSESFQAGVQHITQNMVPKFYTVPDYGQRDVSQVDSDKSRRLGKGQQQIQGFSKLIMAGSPDPPTTRQMVVSDLEGATAEPTPDFTDQQNSNMLGPAASTRSLVPRKGPTERATRRLPSPRGIQYGRSNSIQDKINPVANDTFSGTYHRSSRSINRRPRLPPPRRPYTVMDYTPLAIPENDSAAEVTEKGDASLSDLIKALEDPNDIGLTPSEIARAERRMRSVKQPSSDTRFSEPINQRSAGTKLSLPNQSSFGGVTRYRFSDATLGSQPRSPDISATFPTAVNYTISQDHTDSEDARNRNLLASFGEKFGVNDHRDRNRAAEEHGSHETIQTKRAQQADPQEDTQSIHIPYGPNSVAPQPQPRLPPAFEAQLSQLELQFRAKNPNLTTGQARQLTIEHLTRVMMQR